MTIQDKLSLQCYKQLLHISHPQYSHTLPLQHMLLKLKNAQPIRMITLGGSVTAGMTSTCPVTRPYGMLIQDFLAHDLYDERQVDFLNLGIACSYPLLGLCLVESHIKDFAPDLVMIEFALNESLDKGGIARFESLVRKLMGLPTPPALLILNLADAQGMGASSYMSLIGNHYQLPVINICDALSHISRLPHLSWADYADDTLHPHAHGHAFIADCCTSYLKSIATLPNPLDATQKNNRCALLPTCCFLAPYTNLQFIDATHLHQICETNFMLTSGPHPLFHNVLHNDLSLDCPYLIFTLNCKCLIILFLQDHTLNLATATVYIDQKETYFLQGTSQFVHNHPSPQCLFETSVSQTHQITLELTDEDAYKPFMLFGIAYCV